MSYDLDFWKYKKNTYLNNQSVYEQCSDGKIVEGLEELPIDKIVADITNTFDTWNKVDSESWESPKNKGAFQIYTTSQFVRVDCYNMEGGEMNKFIDVMLKYDCPLYDPQVSQRFDGLDRKE